MEGGRSCTCGDTGCICDPGEAPATLNATTSQNNTSSVSNRGLTYQPPSPESETGLAMLIFALLFAVMLRMR